MLKRNREEVKGVTLGTYRPSPAHRSAWERDVMNITIDHDIEILSSKAYPLTVTRITGLQTIHVHGEVVPVEAVTYCDSAAGCSLAYTRARPAASPEECAAGRRMIQEIAVQAMVEQGIW